MRTEVPNKMREDDIFTKIIESGKMSGMLTYSEINDAFLPGSLCNDELEDIPDVLRDRGVEAVESQEATDFEEEEPVEQEKIKMTMSMRRQKTLFRHISTPWEILQSLQEMRK